jgi:hypothetical protein
LTTLEEHFVCGEIGFQYLLTFSQTVNFSTSLIIECCWILKWQSESKGLTSLQCNNLGLMSLRIHVNQAWIYSSSSIHDMSLPPHIVDCDQPIQVCTADLTFFVSKWAFSRVEQLSRELCNNCNEAICWACIRCNKWMTFRCLGLQHLSSIGNAHDLQDVYLITNELSWSELCSRLLRVVRLLFKDVAYCDLECSDEHFSSPKSITHPITDSIQNIVWTMLSEEERSLVMFHLSPISCDRGPYQPLLSVPALTIWVRFELHSWPTHIPSLSSSIWS